MADKRTQNPTKAGAAILDDLREVLNTYVVFTDPQTVAAITLWIACTHALPAFEFAPRLVLSSPEKRCGKTRAVEIIKGTCHSPLASVNASGAAIFRSIGGEHPRTLIIDEADTVFGSKKLAENNEDVRGILNSGHQRGQSVLRCVGQQNTPTEYPTFAMAVLAGIGSMPDTITDRAINVTMRRRAPHEKVASFRSRRDGPILADVRDRLAVWCAEHIDHLTNATPTMPVDDRAADTWEPLIALADAAGGHWPQTARAACLALVNAAHAADEEHSSRIRLLADIRDIFTSRNEQFIGSEDLVHALQAIEESPWGEFNLNVRKLADRLREFGVRPVRDSSGNRRGYRLADLSDAFSRYLRQETSKPSAPSDEQDEPVDTWASADGAIRQKQVIRQEAYAAQVPYLTDLTCLTERNRHADSGDSCRFCGRHLPPHMTSQRRRGYCNTPACLDAARVNG